MKLYTGGIIMALMFDLTSLKKDMDSGNAGKIFILTGKSASGKDTILKTLVKECNFQPIISTTTRPMRDGEVDGVDYFFISEEEFKNKIERNEFLEYRTYNTCVAGKNATWYYGGTKQELNPNKYYVVVLDMEGANSFLDYYGKENCFVVYIDVDDDIREERASRRGSFDKTEWDRRLADDAIKFSNDILASTINFIGFNDSTDTVDDVIDNIISASKEYFKNKRKNPDVDIFIDYDINESLTNFIITGKFIGRLFIAKERSDILDQF